MVYRLTYRKNETVERTEWITPPGWTEERIRRDFEERYRAQVVALEPIE